MKPITIVAAAGLVAAAAFALFVPTWTGGPVTDQEIAIPGNANFTNGTEQAAVNQPPPPLPPAATGGPSATAAYKNVKVLTDVSAAEFMRLQEAITAWVAPKEGCAFCHAGDNFASDEKPTKLAARTMLEMTRHLNAEWGTHLKQAGVTCYTCHRGNPVPLAAWFPDAPKPQKPFLGKQDNWQEAADTVHKFFPDNGYAEYFLDDQPIVVSSTSAFPNGTLASWPEATRIYEMMMEMSDDIGVNCGYCHQSRNFADWQQSSPYRWVGYDAIRLLRDINQNFLLPITRVMPEDRQLTTATQLPALPDRMRGTTMGNALASCGTCHLGVTRPMNGANMVNDYPGLVGPATLPLPPTVPLPPQPHAERISAPSPG